MFTPNIAASKVAGLIGLNHFQHETTIMFDLMMRDPTLKSKIQAIMTANKRVSLSKLKQDIVSDPDISGLVNAAVRETEGLKDITPVLDAVMDRARTVLSLRHSDISPVVREILVDEVRGAVRCRRGNNNENAALDMYELVNGVKVQDRNTKSFKKVYDGFEINGRTDGFVAEHNRIVDAKERTRKFPKVPIYDEVQLRVYMELSGATESELVETFPDRSRRETKFVNDPSKWSVIHDGIARAVTTMRDTIANEDKLRDLVFANSV